MRTSGFWKVAEQPPARSWGAVNSLPADWTGGSWPGCPQREFNWIKPLDSHIQSFFLCLHQHCNEVYWRIAPSLINSPLFPHTCSTAEDAIVDYSEKWGIHTHIKLGLQYMQVRLTCLWLRLLQKQKSPTRDWVWQEGTFCWTACRPATKKGVLIQMVVAIPYLDQPSQTAP